ncbi:MAG TPA: hypothetical protein VLW45_05860 [Pelomicrobium sp.]|nr:hypothetical protein [Pelomicrobium sp.]
MKRVLWHLHRHWAGWATSAALALIGLGIAFQVAFIAPLERRVDAAREAPALDRAAAYRRMEAGIGRESDPGRQLDRFHDFFVPKGTVADLLAAVYLVAQAEGLTLAQGEYRLSRMADLDLMRYQVTLPVEGPYPALRRFIGGALEAVPVMALEQVQFERKSVSEGRVSAKLRFALYVSGH